ncbi:MAG: hypothetical protein ISR65_20085 [Bacteriovoracaceae bacterium]|nr:hypothetical protein [Bacteriovoracaceae bacterium]
MFLLLILLSLLPIQVWADGNIKKLDLNKDGTIDRIEYYKNKELIQLDEDRNNDGKVDNKTYYNKNGYMRISMQDTNFNGKFDRKVSEKIISMGKVQIKYEVDKNQDGKFEIKYFETANINQKLNGNCIRVLTQHKLNRFISDSLQATAAANKGFLQTNFGYKIDMKCLDQWGMDFPKTVKDTMGQGLQCFMDLDKKLGEKSIVSGALRNSRDLLNLLSKNNVTLVCSEQDYDWDGTAGHASTGPGHPIEKPPANHPYVSLNPKGPESKQAPNEEESLELKKTIFHEQLHNLGFRHNHSIEYPYACEDCCFKDSNSDNEAVEKASCKICTGNYSNETDLKYIEDFVAYTKASYRSSRGTSAVVRYMKENPNDLYSLSMLAWSTSGVFSSVGTQLAKIIEKETSPLPENVKANLEKARYYNTSKGEKSGEVIAQVYYSLYYLKDPDKAVKLLEDNKEKMKAEIEKLQAKDDDQYIGNELSQHLDNLVYDLWVNKYGDEEEKTGSSRRAYIIYTYLNDNK